MTYRFRPFVRDDLPMVDRWLRTPTVLRWWGDGDEQLALLTEDLDEPNMRQWIAEHIDGSGATPFAYAQAYPAHAWGAVHMAHLPAGTDAIDVFLGVPEMLGLGHGAGFMRAFADLLLAEGAACVATDPLAENVVGRRAYARAGFVGDTVIDTVDGPAVLMLRWPAPPPGP